MDTGPEIYERPRDRLRRLYGFMSRHRFVAHRDELTGIGFGWRQIDSWIRNGRLIRVLRSVYAYGRDIESRDAAWRAATLAAGEGSALIGRSACEKWGMVTPPNGIPTVVEVGAPLGQAKHLRGRSPALRHTVVQVVRRCFEPGDIRQVDEVPVTNPALALIDFAMNASDREVRFAFLEACRLKLFGKPDLEYCHLRLRGRRGARKLRPYLALWVPELNRIRSVLEGWFLLVWVRRKLETPQVNVKVFGKEVDFYWPEYRLVLELDGDAFHSDPVQKQIDLEKQRFLESQGMTVLRATYKEFAADPDGVVDRVLAHQVRR
ncbi:MAG: DUF559 domain-containing protein [Solirubrobacterales bacterium]|nr:DUF559 domain-containing protein [Solirubrobacterales bacterium]OJU95625.1 MAG: hypothetical protein BGO23_08410 [Solirubrobacterales bacterium 67-14]